MVEPSPVHLAESGDGDKATDVGDRNTASLKPHEGLVFVDQHPGGAWQLTHVVTGERTMLQDPPDGMRYAMAYDDEGFGMIIVVDTDGQEQDEGVIVVDGALRFDLYETGDGELLIVHHDRLNGKQVVRLSDFGRHFSSSELRMVYGPSRRLCEMEVAIFKWPRGSSKIFVSLASLYTSLCFEQFGKQPSRWVYNCRARWTKLFDSYGLSSALQMSDQVGKNGSGSKDLAEAGVLPFNGVSPTGLVLLLHRFAFCHERHCGVRSEDSKLNSRWLLEKLVEPALVSLRAAPLRLDMVRCWHSIYPRPRQYTHPVDLAINSDGSVDMGQWRKLAEGDAAPRFASSAWTLIPAAFRDGCSLVELLKVLGDPGAPDLHSLFAQVIDELGSLLHSFWFDLAKSGRMDHGMKMKAVDVEDLLTSRTHVSNIGSGAQGRICSRRYSGYRGDAPHSAI